MSLTVGTAGHVDHGKTWLVRALTGKDTDRLPDEQRRGISIELGYAQLPLPDGRAASLVDVPGHERFVRTMVAGASGIDAFLLVVDAAEGAREQTHEHLGILRLLGIDRGVVAVTKADAVTPETVALAVAEARELVPGAPVVAVSARTGGGLEELRAAIGANAGDRPASAWPARLYVDRAFTLRGIGTVVTGTLWSGSIGEGDRLRVEPAGTDVRVRSVEIHDTPVGRAHAGRRVAVSLPGVARTEIRRGEALVAPGAYPVAYRLDVALEELERIADGASVRVHHGTAERQARVVRAAGPYAQLRLDAPVVAARGDRFVLRAGRTVGGGRVLDPAPARHRDRGRFELLASSSPTAVVRAAVREPVRQSDLAARGLLPPTELACGLAALERGGEWYFPGEWLAELRADVDARLAERSRTSVLEPGIPLRELVPDTPWAAAVVPLLAIEQRGAWAYSPGTRPQLDDRADAAARLEAELAAAGPAGVRVKDRALAAYLEHDGRLVRLGDGLAVSAPAYTEVRRTVIAECERAGSIRLARLRDLLAVSRRPAQLLLERLDADGVTLRIGDERVVRRSARASA